jgi:Mg-chelatase subunit ChlD
MKYQDWSPSRLAGAKEAAKAFVRRLAEADPDARVAIVAYSAHAHVISKLQSVLNVAAIAHRINRIKTGSDTNITSGLEAARMILRNSCCDQQVVLLTDGQHNFGPGPETVGNHLRQSAVLECVGMAGTPDAVDRRLPELASTDEFGRKRYRWIGDPEQLVRVFEQLATGLTRE